jgi:ribonuclease HI
VEGKQSNNTAELGAILHTYPIIEADILAEKKIKIVSDSQYAIRCATTYGEKCEKQGWSKDIPNKELVKQVYDLYKNKSNIKFIHILSHTGNTDVHSMGNDGADKLANQAIGLDSCPYNRQEERLYLNVPFEKKDEIKALGGRWDFPKKKWYILNTSEHVTEVLTKFKTAF